MPMLKPTELFKTLRPEISLNQINSTVSNALAPIFNMTPQAFSNLLKGPVSVTKKQTNTIVDSIIATNLAEELERERVLQEQLMLEMAKVMRRLESQETFKYDNTQVVADYQREEAELVKSVKKTWDDLREKHDSTTVKITELQKQLDVTHARMDRVVSQMSDAVKDQRNEVHSVMKQLDPVEGLAPEQMAKIVESHGKRIDAKDTSDPIKAHKMYQESVARMMPEPTLAPTEILGEKESLQEATAATDRLMLTDVMKMLSQDIAPALLPQGKGTEPTAKDLLDAVKVFNSMFKAEVPNPKLGQPRSLAEVFQSQRDSFASQYLQLNQLSSQFQDLTKGMQVAQSQMSSSQAGFSGLLTQLQPFMKNMQPSPSSSSTKKADDDDQDQSSQSSMSPLRMKPTPPGGNGPTSAA